ncbi:MAG: glycosyltransferase family 2 protein [Phycisphaerales bacterium]
MPPSSRHPTSTHAVWPTEGTLPLSAAIVCKDSVTTIGRTIRSLRGLAREVVVLDSGSTDGTLQLLHRMGVNAQHQNWLGYIAQKNCVLQMCRQPWIISLDSDESLEEDLRGAIVRALGGNEPSADGFEINRKVYYKGAWLDHAWQPEWRLRLVRNGAAEWTGYDPHDELVLKSPTGRRERLDGVMRHDSIESIAEFLAKQCRHGRTAAKALHARGKHSSMLSLVTSPTGAWLKQMVARSAWRDGWRGWLAAGAAAAAAFAKHAALIELDRAPHNASSAGHDTRAAVDSVSGPSMHDGSGHA